MSVQNIQLNFNHVNQGWSKDQCTKQAVNELLAKKFSEIVVSYAERKEAQSIKDLAAGPWYPNDYALALKKHNQNKRLEFFVNKNAFYHGFPPKGFSHQRDVTNNLTGMGACSYKILADHLPLQALENMKNGQVSFTDCGSAIELAIYETLQEIYGDHHFNALFSATDTAPLAFNPHIEKTPLGSLGIIQEIPNFQRVSPDLGDNVFFTNIPLYNLKHPNGEAKGFHAVCISPADVVDKKYIALGVRGEKTEEEMTDILINEFNVNPFDPSLIFTNRMAQFFSSESQQAEAQFSLMTGSRIQNFTIDRAQFDLIIQQTNHVQAGLLPIIKRLNIEVIQKYLPSNAI